MSKLAISKTWSQLLLASVITMMIRTTLVVKVIAFQSYSGKIRMESFPSTPMGYGARHSSSSTTRWIISSSFALKSKDGDDDNDAIIVQNSTKSNENDDHSIEKPIGHSTDEKVDELLALLDTVPSNLPTPKSLTDKILAVVKALEEVCPTSEEAVLSELSGNWALLWTTQDRSSDQYVKGGLANRFINPLENQSYANNPFRGQNPLLGDDNNDDGPSGRANPILPREIQDALERIGILEATGGTKLAPIRSSQGIDIKRKRVRNVVNVQIKRPFSVKGSLVVDVHFKPNDFDKRKIDVKFDACRFVFQNANIDQKFPLGIFGPTGWLRTGYIDDRIRITRGHKGSVFILSRTSKRIRGKKE